MEKGYYYFYLDGHQTLEEAISQYLLARKKDKNLQFLILADKNFVVDDAFKSKCSKMIDALMANGIMPASVTFALDEDQKRFSAAEWERLGQIEAFFSKQRITFGLEDGWKVWTIQEVEYANKLIVSTADQIRSKNLSPYEKLMLAYLVITERQYKFEDKDQHFAQSRSVYGVLNSDSIVCLGYAELLKALIEDIGDESIKVYINHVECSRDGKTIDAGHANIILQIKDEKYGIDGLYYLDPTWDAGHEWKTVPDISYFMVPLSDVDKITGYQIRGNWAGLKKRKKDEKTPSAKSKNNKKQQAHTTETVILG